MLTKELIEILSDECDDGDNILIIEQADSFDIPPKDILTIRRDVVNLCVEIVVGKEEEN